MTLKIPAFDLPESALISAATRAALKQQRDDLAASNTDSQQDPIAAFYQGRLYKRLRNRYEVTVETGLINQVPVEIFNPKAGIATQNQGRVLINLHGGGFEAGSRTSSHMESIPVAALGKIQVISVDYRMAPEYRFPAATEDVVAVYQALLQDYPAQNIGIYGASSGAHLAAQTLVWLQQNKLPRPAAVGLIAEGATPMAGDSVAFIGALLKEHWDLHTALQSMQYLEDADLQSPQVTPALSDTLMSKFPPSLLLSSTRDFMMSSVVATHAQLVRLGVPADLHIWEGLDHTFHYNPDLPESEALHQVLIQFFSKHLGKEG